MAKRVNKKRFLKTLVLILEFLVLGLIIFLIVAPFYPGIKYRLSQPLNKIEPGEAQNITPASQTDSGQNQATSTKPKLSGNYLKIAKIGVDIPIIESKNSDYALSMGAWRLPETSIPDKGSNMAIAGHRFKYLPPNNLTFYLLDKLVVGDILIIDWSAKEYRYKVVKIMIVSPEDISVLEPTAKTTLTLITCDPIWSQKNRLIVVAELVES